MSGPGAGATIARDVLAGFSRYVEASRGITAEAHADFLAGDWATLRGRASQHLDTYAGCLADVVEHIRKSAGPQVARGIWVEARDEFVDSVASHPMREIAATFFNSTSRRLFTTEGVDDSLEIFDLEPPQGTEGLRLHSQPALSLPQALERIFVARPFGEHWEDAGGSAELVAAGVRRQLASLGVANAVQRIELLDYPFYRGQAGYLVGAVHVGPSRIGMAIAIEPAASGLRATAAMVGPDDLTILFSYTRSQFLVETARPSALVSYLAGLMPDKPRAELYSSIGFYKHGKTELFRDMKHHLDATSELFERAPGVPGTVMEVFAMPGYDFVFKVIRDRFPHTKRVTRQGIVDSYYLVFRHDRAGRLIDAHEFEHLRLPTARFRTELLDELADSAGRTVSIDDQWVTLHHAYVERKVTPLDLYIRNAHPAAAEGAVIDYGRAIKNMAASNIFPGDLLLKNFGVTRRGRVVFYDYDELKPMTDCNFRHLPQSEDPDDVLADEPWFGVDEDDIFPEEFERFLGLPPRLKEPFLRYHADLLDTAFWVEVQERLERGEVIEILPYRRSRLLGGRRFGAVIP